MGFRAWVCLTAVTLAACGAPSTPDSGVGGGTGGGETGGGSGGGGGGTSGVANDTCQTAEAITMAGTVSGTTKGATKNYSPECTGFPNDGEDVVYAVTVPAGNRVTANVVWIDPAAAAFDPSMYIVSGPADACDAKSADGGNAVVCLAGVDDSEGGDETIEWLNDSTAERVVFLVVDSYRGTAQPGTDGGVGKGTSGDFILEVSYSQPLAGDGCGSAIALTPGTPLTQQMLAGYNSDFSGSTTCAGSVGVDRAYKVTVPAGNVLSVTVTPSSTFDPMLSASTSAATCGTTCIANADTGANGAAETLSWKNTTAAPVELFIVVDAYGNTTGTFGIAATLSNPGVDDVCSGATALTAGTPLQHTTEGYGNDYALQTGSTGCATSGYAGPDRVYTFDVPPMQRGRVTVTPAASTFNPSLNVLAAGAATCEAMPRVCSSGINVAGNGAAESISIVNTTATAASYFGFVDSSTAAGAAYEIAYVVDTPPADDTCATAQTDVDGGTITGNLTGFVQDYGGVGAGCFAAGGPDRVYRAHLGAGQKLIASITPADADGGFDGVVNFMVGGCDTLPRTCAGGFDFGLRGAVESGAFSNTTASPVELFMVVSDYETTSANRDFTLATSIEAVTAGESCELPLVTGAAAFASETLVGASSELTFSAAATSCVSTNQLPDRVYEISVGAGQQLTAIATPAAGVNLALNLIDGACRDIATCLANANAGAAGAAETLRWTNNGGTPRVVKLLVGGVPAGAYTLELQLQ